MYKKWTEADGIWCRDMYAAGKAIVEIAASLGRSVHSVDDYLRRHEIARDRQSRSLAKWRERVYRRALLGEANAAKRLDVPAAVIADRDRRLNEYRTPAQILMGEPPPSQSALARQPGNSADRAEH